MTKPQLKPSLSGIRRQPIHLAPARQVTTTSFSECGSLPLVVTPTVPDLDLDLRAWAVGHAAEVEAWVLRHGAVLFRGFAINGVPGFERCVDALAGGALEYRFRASPRTEVGKHVYTATDYPAEQHIFPHNEHSYSPVCPLELVFYAETPAPQGGETPLGDNREVMRRIDPAVIERFVRLGILYVRNYGAGFGLPWRTVFQTEDRAEVERYCAGIGVRCEWKSDDRLCTRQVGPAVIRHPRSGEKIWFNHGTFFHVTTLPDGLGDALQSEFDDDDLPQNTYYGDGSPIEPEVLDHLRAAYRGAMVSFPWARDDVLLIDNVLAVHARRPYSGFRRVLVSMAQTFRTADYAVTEWE